MKLNIFRSLLLVPLTLLALASPAAAAELAPQKSTERGVTIAVTPNIGTPDAWVFKIVLDTHSQDLNDDLAATAVLVDPAGRQHRPLVWEGAPPGGHHREGLLRFSAINPPPAFLELQIRRPGESAPRSFKWQLVK